MTMPEGFHPFPYRTRKLRPPGLRILGPQGPGKVSRCQVANLETTLNKRGLFVSMNILKVRVPSRAENTWTAGSWEGKSLPGKQT